MAVFNGFHAMMPPQDKVSQVAAVPYDVVNSEEAAELAKGNPLSFLRVSRPEIEMPEGTDLHSDPVYAKAAANFKRLIEEAPLTEDPVANLYVYSLKMNGRLQIGIAGAASVEDYENNVIKKHEKTRKDKEDDRARHVMDLRSHTGPVFLTYRGNPEIDAIVASITAETPYYSFVAPDGIEHKLWKAGAERTLKLSELFRNRIPCFYIADGHHRAASAVNLYTEKREAAGASFTGEEPFCYFMAAIFADTELCIIDYNRIVRGLNDPTEVFLGKLRDQKFEVAELTGSEKPPTPSFLEFHYARPIGERTFSMYLRGKWYKLRFTGEIPGDNPVDSIESEILTHYVLGPIFGVKDVRSDPNLSFIGGTRGLKALEEGAKDEHALAFAVPPVTMNQIFAVADCDKVMPPKSTWFVPKLATGMVVRLIE